MIRVVMMTELGCRVKEEVSLDMTGEADGMNLGVDSRFVSFSSYLTLMKLGYGFLFAFHSNYGSVFYHFRDKAK